MELNKNKLTLVTLAVLFSLTLGLMTMLLAIDVEPVEAAACYQYLYSFECRDECWPSLSCSNGTLYSDCWYTGMSHYTNGDHYTGNGHSVNSCNHYVSWCYQSCF